MGGHGSSSRRNVKAQLSKLPYALDIQFFGKKSLEITKADYALVTSELVTWMADDEKRSPILKKQIRDHEYLISNPNYHKEEYPHDGFVILKKTTITPKRRTKHKKRKKLWKF